MLENCMLCPRKCKVNRLNKEKGFCGALDALKVARVSLHMWEEPCLSGSLGSGTIFFSFCTLKCIFCQNYEISTKNYGLDISIQKFADLCLELQNKGALNINLVTPTHFVPLIKEGLILAKAKGLKIPIVYNSSGYETKETIQILDGIVDIYLPDFKYFSDELALKYSHAKDYVKYAKESIEEMFRQQPNCVIENDIMKKGVIVRHLMLPTHLEDSKRILKYLYDRYGNQIYISIMSQYTPLREIKKHPHLNRKIDRQEYDKLILYALNLGIENAFIQEAEAADKSFIPSFKGEGISQ